MATYQDVYDTSKTTEDIHNTMAVTYEMMSEKGIDDPETELTDEDHTAVRDHLKSVIPELQSFLDQLTGQTPADEALEDVLTKTHEQVGEAVEERLEREDGVVRIVLNIPAHHLSEAQREKLEKDVVREAAIYSKMWMDALEYGGESLVMNEEKVEPEDIEIQEAEEGVDLPPEEVITDVAQKWRQTYEQMRPDYNEEDYDELEVAVIECLIEDGYITPGPHYNVETETVRTVGGDKTTFVTGPKGSKTVKGKRK